MSLIPIDYFRVRHHLELPHAGHFADGAAVTAGQQQVKKIDYDTDTGFYLVLSHDGTVFHIPREAAAFHVVKADAKKAAAVLR